MQTCTHPKCVEGDPSKSGQEETADDADAVIYASQLCQLSGCISVLSHHQGGGSTQAGGNSNALARHLVDLAGQGLQDSAGYGILGFAFNTHTHTLSIALPCEV